MAASSASLRSALSSAARMCSEPFCATSTTGEAETNLRTGSSAFCDHSVARRSRGCSSHAPVSSEMVKFTRCAARAWSVTR